MQWQFPCPQVLTDSFKGQDDGFGKDWRSRQLAHAAARKAGVNPTGKRFVPQMCRKGVRFDPMAWVSDRADVKRRCLKEGWGMNEEDGGLKAIKAREVEPVREKPYEVAPDIVNKQTAIAAAREYGGKLTPREKADLREKTRTRLRGNAD